MPRRKPQPHKRPGRKAKIFPSIDSIEPIAGPVPEFSTVPRPQTISFNRPLASNDVPSLDELFPKERK
jgi:hypothetical protein